MGEVGQRVEAVARADDRNALFGLQQVGEDALALLVENPFVDGNAVHIFKQPAEGGSGIAAPVGELLHVLHGAVVLHHEVMETFGVEADGVEEGADLGQRIVAGEDVDQFAAFQVDVAGAGGGLLLKIAYHSFQQSGKQRDERERGIDHGGFGVFQNLLVFLFADEGQLGKPVDDVLRFRQCQQLQRGADALQDDLFRFQRGAGMLFAVDQQFAFQHENHAILRTLLRREVLSLGVVVMDQYAF